MKTISEILNSFNQPFTQYISKKPVFTKGKKSGEVSFISWPNLCEILDQFAPGWEWEIKSCDYHGDRIVLIGRLTIHGSDGSLTREATGNEDSHCDGYGDPSSNAEAMAMRRCCSKFGIARYLWFKEQQQQTTETPEETAATITKTSSEAKEKPLAKGQISKEEYERRKLEQIAKNGIKAPVYQAGNITIVDDF